MRGVVSSPSHRGRPMFKFIRRLVLQSAVFVIMFQYISNILFPDHNADAFRTLLTPPVSVFDTAVRQFLVGFSRWDAQHYLHIAQFGYTYEHSIAFFPLFPSLIYAATIVWYPIIPWSLLSFPTALLFSGVVLNVLAFFGAAWFLFALTKNVLSVSNDQQKAESTAVLAVVLFVLNPANIFFRAIYTESMYAFLTFLGMNCLLWKRYVGSPTSGLGSKPGKNLLESAICFGLAMTVRSNGLLNLGYMLYYYAAFWLKPFFAFPGRTNSGRGGRIRQITLRRHVKELIPTIPVLLLALTSSLVPFLTSQYYHYQQFCSRETARRTPISYEVAQLASKNGYVLPGDMHNLHWCIDGDSRISSLASFSTLPYTAVQGKYWQVGLFGYYRWRKIPLFILASPTFILAVSACMHYLTGMRLSHGDRISKLVHPQSVLPFVVHVVVLTVVGVLFINVEVLTRMLFSSSPLLYWYCATILQDHQGVELNEKAKMPVLDLENAGLYQVIKYLWNQSGRSGKLILAWFCGYTIIGTAAFANFLPWT